MTGIQRLQHLPVPGGAPGAVTVVAPGRSRETQAIQPVDPASAPRHEPGQTQGTPQRERPAGLLGKALSGTEDAPSQEKPVRGKLFDFSKLASVRFIVQLLGQQLFGIQAQAPAAAAEGAATVASAEPAARPPVVPENSLTGHRDAARLGSEIYRKAGGEPEMLPTSATFVRLVV